MKIAVAGFGLVVAAIGLLGLISPPSLRALIEKPSPRARWMIAFALRFTLGLLLIISAPDSRYPEALRVLGYLALVACLVLLLMGEGRLQSFTDWWLSRDAAVLRAAASFALLFGVFLVYSVLPV